MNWLRSNFDIAAVAVIIGFMGVGSSVVKVAQKPALIFGVDPVIRQVQPRVMEIRKEVDEEIRRQGRRFRTRQTIDTIQLKQGFRRASVDLGREIREVFR